MSQECAQAAVYTLIHWQDLFTDEWLTAIGTITTGVFAVYAAFQSNRLAREEHRRTIAAAESAAKGYCFRVASELWLAGNSLALTAKVYQKHAANPAAAWASLSTMKKAADDLGIPILKSGVDVFPSMPGGLPIALNSILSELESIPKVVNGGFRFELIDYGGPFNEPIGLTPEGMKEGSAIANLVLGVSVRAHACLRAMEKFVGQPLAPWDDNDTEPSA